MKSGILPARDGGIQGAAGPGTDGLIQIDLQGETFMIDRLTAYRLIGEIAATLECIEVTK
jgi:hypothetical protein